MRSPVAGPHRVGRHAESKAAVVVPFDRAGATTVVCVCGQLAGHILDWQMNDDRRLDASTARIARAVATFRHVLTIRNADAAPTNKKCPLDATSLTRAIHARRDGRVRVAPACSRQSLVAAVVT